MADETISDATNTAPEGTQPPVIDPAVSETPAEPAPAPVEAVAAPAAAPAPTPSKPASAKEQRAAAAAARATDKAVVAPVKAPPVAEPTPVVVVQEEPEIPASLVVNDGDDDQVVELKAQLLKLVNELKHSGSEPENFRNAAQRALSMTRHVIQYPKVPVLDALLAFFEENIDGVCDPSVYLKGSTTLSNIDEQQVGFLYGLFADLARKQVIRTNSQLVIQILKKPEILNYYDRKVSFLAQNARA